MFLINHGPFRGVAFGADEAYRLPGDPISGEPDKAGIVVSALNQRFLDKFSPLDGWSVRFRRTLLELDMYPLARYGEVVTEPVPCVEFTAELVSAEDRVINSASSIWTIRGPTEWEKGETNARIRLYEAVGLQARFPLPDGAQLVSAPEMPGGTVEATVARKGGAAVVQLDAHDDSMPTFQPVVDDEDDKPRPRAAVVHINDGENPLGDGPAANSPAAAQEPVSPAAPAQASLVSESASSGGHNVVPMRSKKPRKERLPDDAPAPEAIKTLAAATARLRGVTVPDNLTTKGDFNAFIAQFK